MSPWVYVEAVLRQEDRVATVAAAEIERYARCDFPAADPGVEVLVRGETEERDGLRAVGVEGLPFAIVTRRKPGIELGELCVERSA